MKHDDKAAPSCVVGLFDSNIDVLNLYVIILWCMINTLHDRNALHKSKHSRYRIWVVTHYSLSPILCNSENCQSAITSTCLRNTLGMVHVGFASVLSEVLYFRVMRKNKKNKKRNVIFIQCDTIKVNCYCIYIK